MESDRNQPGDAMGIFVGIEHPQSDTSESEIITNPLVNGGKPVRVRELLEQDADADGHLVVWRSGKMTEVCLAVIAIRHGMDARYAVEILHKAITAIEKNPHLLNQPQDAMGKVINNVAFRLKTDRSGFEKVE
jgi:hypothetical protein